MSSLTIVELLERVAIDIATLRRLEEEGLVEPEMGEGGMLVYSEAQIERVRIARDLLDLGVNDEGIEIILSMRERLLGMQDVTRELLSLLRAEPEEHDADQVRKRIQVSILGE